MTISKIDDNTVEVRETKEVVQRWDKQDLEEQLEKIDDKITELEQKKTTINEWLTQLVTTK